MSDGGIGPTTSRSSTEIGRAPRVTEPGTVNLARNGPRRSFREVARLRDRLRLIGSAFTPNYTLWATAAGPLETQFLTDEQNTLRQRMFSAISRAKESTKKRREKGRDHDDVEIDVAYLAELYRRQHGRCAYTRVPLAVKGKFKWSLERKENDKGYTKLNTVLVIKEVNLGNAQWSKKKADKYWGGPVPI